MDRGYFALWRKFQEHRFWKEKRVFSKAEAWIDILWETQHKKEPQQVVFGMKVLICNYGESLKSIRTWAKRWGWGRPKTHRFLKLLQNMRQIDTVSETVTTRITVLNYKEYDPRNSCSETQSCHDRATSVPDAYTDKKDKKEKKEKTYIDLPDWMPKKIWDEFKKYRVRIKKPLTPYAERLNLKKLKKLKDSGDDPVKVVERTIMKGWHGFFPLKDQNVNPSINYEGMQ